MHFPQLVVSLEKILTLENTKTILHFPRLIVSLPRNMKTMEKKEHKYIEVAYCLYNITDGQHELMEEAPAEQPFSFITALGMALPAFEEQVKSLSTGEKFQFTLKQEDAYGPRFEERIIDLDKEIFTINGHFDHENIFVDAMVPLQNEDGNQFIGRVLSINEEKVRMDLNHPLAGMELEFQGEVILSRDATDKEIEHLLNHSCGCGHEHCDCHHDHDKETDCGCGCGHCHE